MTGEEQVVFGPFRFECSTGRLWRGDHEVRLRARTGAVLGYLLEHAGRVISRQEFAQHVWRYTHVSQSVLRVCIWELRQALGEQGDVHRYIETVGRQGYRFCIEPQRQEAAASQASPFVGRQTELSQLQQALDDAQHGRPQFVFITGDVGIGKTALVQQFLSHLPASVPLRIGHGQCVEHFGPGEAYLPLLEALGRLGREPRGERLLAELRRVAPTWLVHLPMLLEAGELEVLQRQVQGAQTARMLRELADVLTAVTQDTPLVLVLEDLHWSDTATVEALAYLARRQDPLKLLLLGTYRPADLILREHPLRQTVQELVAHQLCRDLPLELLNAQEVCMYVAQRLGDHASSANLADVMYRRTDGNALFTVQMLGHLLHQGLLIESGGQWWLRGGLAAMKRHVPEALRALLLKQLEALDAADRKVLDAASVGGLHFVAAEVAAGLQCPEEEVEAICDRLAQRGQFLEAQELVTWPDGTSTVRYGFRHALYRDVIYARLGMAQRSRLHRLVGERLASGYGERAKEIASELALHFECGQDFRRAVTYRQYAAEQALHRSAYREALMHGTEGLKLLDEVPESAERVQQELGLRYALNVALTATQGYTADELAHNLEETLALCETVDATTELVPVVVGLTRLFMLRSERQATEALMARERALVFQLHDTTALVQLHTQLSTAETLRGAHHQARQHYQEVMRLYDPEVHRSLALTFVDDPAVTALSLSGWRLWLTGWPDQALEQAARALAYAEELAHPFSRTIALTSVTQVRQCRGEWPEAWASAQALVTLGASRDLLCAK